LVSKLISLYLYAADTSNPTATSKYKDKERYTEFYDDSIHYTVFSENEKKLDEPDAILEMALQRTVVIDQKVYQMFESTKLLEALTDGN
jgi:hypothetical protein